MRPIHFAGPTIVLCLLACAPASVTAQKAPASATTPPVDCTKGSSTPEIAQCAAEDLKIADMQLSAAYLASLAAIDRAAHLNVVQRRDWKRAFQEAHRHWLAFRDKDCGQLIGWEWFRGTGMATASLSCKAAKTRARVEELNTRYGAGTAAK